MLVTSYYICLFMCITVCVHTSADRSEKVEKMMPFQAGPRHQPTTKAAALKHYATVKAYTSSSCVPTPDMFQRLTCTQYTD